MTRAANLSRQLEASGPFHPDAMGIREARRIARDFYRANGRADRPQHLWSTTGKLEHSATFNCGITLRPGDASGFEACQWRTAGCTAACVLETSFRGKDADNRDSRTLKTRFLAEHPQAFVTILAHELRGLVAKHGAVAFRPNIASDLRWEYIAPDLFGIPGVRAYDYTKANPLKHRGRIDNYRLCYSVSESPLSEAIGAAYVKSGGTAAVVVDTPKHAVPAVWNGFPAVDGDATDDRTTDPTGCYVLLAVKADGKGDTSGFVKQLPLAVAS
jgi:hypothetical protein